LVDRNEAENEKDEAAEAKIEEDELEEVPLIDYKK